MAEHGIPPIIIFEAITRAWLQSIQAGQASDMQLTHHIDCYEDF